MKVYIGVDFHARSQTISYLTTEDGEIHTRRLDHDKDDVRGFYKEFTGEVIVGFEASGYCEWFEEMLEGLNYQVWVGDAAEIRRMARRRQKNDKRDADLILELMVRGDFPRVHRQSKESRDILKQLRYRHRMVKMRTIAKNSLQAMAISAGLRLQTRLHSRMGRQKLKGLNLSPIVMKQAEQINKVIDEMTAEVKRVENWLTEEANNDPRVKRLKTHPGVGLLTSLALVHTLWPVNRFPNPRKVTAYLGMDPVEDSSGDRVRIGSISKQGSTLTRFLVIEAGIVAARSDQQLKNFYQRLGAKRGKARAKVAVGRKLIVRCFIMLRDEIDYEEFLRRGVEVRSARPAQ